VQAREKSRGYPANPAVSPRYRDGCFIRNNVASDKTAAKINALLAHYGSVRQRTGPKSGDI